MSAFLGPIHHKMYGKCNAQSELAFAIATFSDKQGWTQTAQTDLKAQFPLLDGALEDLIDTSDIHGWLSNQVELAEARLATAVQCAVGQEKDRSAVLLEFIQQYAKDLASSRHTPAQDCAGLWQLMDLYWVDGMPCDRVVHVASREDGSIDWSIDAQAHEKGWEDATILPYALLRWTWVQAFAERQGFVATQSEDLFFHLAQEG